MGGGVSALFVYFVTCLVAPVASIEHQSRMFDGGALRKCAGRQVGHPRRNAGARERPRRIINKTDCYSSCVDSRS